MVKGQTKIDILLLMRVWVGYVIDRRTFTLKDSDEMMILFNQFELLFSFFSTSLTLSRLY